MLTKEQSSVFGRFDDLWPLTEIEPILWPKNSIHRDIAFSFFKARLQHLLRAVVGPCSVSQSSYLDAFSVSFIDRTNRKRHLHLPYMSLEESVEAVLNEYNGYEIRWLNIQKRQLLWL